MNDIQFEAIVAAGTITLEQVGESRCFFVKDHHDDLRGLIHDEDRTVTGWTIIVITGNDAEVFTTDGEYPAPCVMQAMGAQFLAGDVAQFLGMIDF